MFQSLRLDQAISANRWLKVDYKKYLDAIPDDIKSDGCTLASDGSWKKCCVLHDAARRDRAVSDSDADRMLYDCMRDEAIWPLAALYYVWVRIQGITKMSPFTMAAITTLVTVVVLLAIYG